jgi:DNA-binding Lrp family transcriptional regulator
VLLLLRDIVDGTVDEYQQQLIDKPFRDTIPTLKAKASSCLVVYLNIQSKDPKTFASSICNELSSYLPKKGPRVKKASAPEADFVTVAEEVNNSLSNTQRLVILLDEVDGLLDSRDSKQIFRTLRSIVQSCPKICFLIAGAELWHQAIKEKTSPLVNNVFAFYLKSAEAYPVEEYLMKGQLIYYLSPSSNIDKISETIREWTGGKPWCVQAVCYEVVEACGDSQQLPTDWETIVETKVMTAVGPTLGAFFQGDNLDDVTRKILALLANKPGLSIKEIARGLGLSEKAIWDKIADLEALDKVRKQGSDYYIVGTLLEKYGKNTQEVPRIKSKWPQRLKWVAAIVLVFIAIWLYWYTHPPLQAYTVAYPAGIMSIRMPSSLEQDETGAAVISVHNTTVSEMYTITLSLESTDIDYQHNGSNRVSLDTLRAGEIRYWEPRFSVRSPTYSAIFSSSVTITQDTSQFFATYPFEISQRAIPIKKYWAVVSLLLVTISGFLTKQDLSQLVTSLFSGLLKSQRNAENLKG